MTALNGAAQSVGTFQVPVKWSPRGERSSLARPSERRPIDFRPGFPYTNQVIPRRTPSGYSSILRDALVGLIASSSPVASIHRFEEAFSQLIGAEHCVAVSSGRLGLLLLLDSYDLEPGSEVLMAAYNFHVVPEIVRRAGLTPVFVDVDRSTMNVTAETVARRMGPRTSAVLVTHLFGQPAEIEPMAELCQRKGVVLIEDCAHALGARIGDRSVGTFGHAGFYSFETIKHVNTFGGGMVVLADGNVAARFRRGLQGLPPPSRVKLAARIGFASVELALSNRLVFGTAVAPLLARQYAKGQDGGSLVKRYKKAKRKPGNFHWGYTALQAEAGLRQLPLLDDGNRRRRRLAAALDEILEGVIPVQQVLDGTTPAYYMYVVRSTDALGLIRALFRRKVDATRHVMQYCPPLFGSDAELPVSKQLHEEVVQLPFHSCFSYADIETIGRALVDSVRAPGGD
jgi:dTDP-4-amino-4,6-dideoxygalactose transaminase